MTATIPNFAMYMVTDTGIIYSTKYEKLLVISQYLSNGYLRVTLNKDGRKFNRFVHRLVLETFVGKCPKGYEACHLDGNPYNNTLINLRWVTHHENILHKLIHGTIARGISHGQCKLTEDEVVTIKTMLKQGKRHKDIAELFSVSKSTITAIKSGRLWSHI